MVPVASARQDVAPDLARAMVVASSGPLLLLDGDLSVIAASTSFCRAFQVELGSVSGRPFLELGTGEWNDAQLADLLRAAAAGYADLDSLEIDLARQGQETRRLVVNASKLDYADMANVRMLVTITDVTAARKAEQRKDDLIREKAILMQELQHRVGNSLQVIASVIMQSAMRVTSAETRSQLYATHERILSVATVQKQLAASSRGKVDLRPYLTSLCNSLGASMICEQEQLRLEASVDDRAVSADEAMSLGLIVTELVINALKHAFPDRRNGRIAVGYSAQGSNWALSVRDDGVGMPADPENARGLGMVIVAALARQLNARIKIADADPGVAVSIVHAQLAAVDGAASAQVQRPV